MEIRCGKCIGCRTDHATLWAKRAMHEASLHKYNRFLTLTYDDEHLPDNAFLRLRDIQTWMKRLRKAAKHKVRYLISGEYGEHTQRPHYHALLFGHKFDDEQQAGKDLYLSHKAENIWQLGAVRIGKVTGASANYVAQYTVKDTGWRPVTPDGELGRAPFLTMSRNPGIGMPWYAKFKDDLRNGYLVSEGKRGAIPRAYTKKYAGRDKEELDYLRYLAMKDRQRPTPEQLIAGEVIHHARRQLTETTTL